MPGVPNSPRALDSYEQLKKGVKNLFSRKKKAAKKGPETDEPEATADSGEATAPSATDASRAEPAAALETQTESVTADQPAQPAVSVHENTGPAQVTEEPSK
ncbi:hypothetical protein N7510_006231 [Penicillium lagena]|uniref:uncharacterized protein n=1 Tax=Penicillium lagena TaxID=94218 RepID=UPI002540AFD6|nr:uncharacterized protein N7510_006231 [Penicillium lagena]KAJ5613037.1 hypothetical protein N7510_006231 [Penicillium lagena]